MSLFLINSIAKFYPQRRRYKKISKLLKIFDFIFKKLRMSLSLQQKIEMLEFYLQHNKSVTAARAAYCTAKGLRTGPSVSAFKKVYATFRETGSVNRERSKRPRTVRTGLIFENVRTLNEERTSDGQSLSIRPGAREVGISNYH